MKKNIKLYNLIFPVSMFLTFAPSFWIISAAGNFIIDSIVLLFIILILCKKMDWSIYKKAILRVWIAGFASDFIGSLILTLVSLSVKSNYYYGNGDLLSQIKTGIYHATNFSPFRSLWGVMFAASGILIAAICIFIFNYFISFKSIDFTKKQKLLAALSLAVFTAPYTFLLPVEWF